MSFSFSSALLLLSSSSSQFFFSGPSPSPHSILFLSVLLLSVLLLTSVFFFSVFCFLLLSLSPSSHFFFFFSSSSSSLAKLRRHSRLTRLQYQQPSAEAAWLAHAHSHMLSIRCAIGWWCSDDAVVCRLRFSRDTTGGGHSNQYFSDLTSSGMNILSRGVFPLVRQPISYQTLIWWFQYGLVQGGV